MDFPVSVIEPSLESIIGLMHAPKYTKNLKKKNNLKYLLQDRVQIMVRTESLRRNQLRFFSVQKARTNINLQERQIMRCEYRLSSFTNITDAVKNLLGKYGTIDPDLKKAAVDSN